MSRVLSVVSLVCVLLAPNGPVSAQEALPRTEPGEVGLSAEGLEHVTDLLNRFVELFERMGVQEATNGQLHDSVVEPFFQNLKRGHRCSYLINLTKVSSFLTPSRNA